jgi:hypothetical protein
MTGRLDEKKILDLFRNGYFTVVQLSNGLQYNERLTDNSKHTLGTHYVLVRSTRGWEFYIPKNKAERGD